MHIRTLVVTADAGERARLSLLFAPVAGDHVAITPHFASALDEERRDGRALPDLLLLAPGAPVAGHDAVLPATAGFEGVPVIVIGDAIGIAGARRALSTGLADDVILSTDSRPETLGRLVAAIGRGRARAQARIGRNIVLAAMADAVIVTDAGGRICYCNESACRLAARPHADMLGMRLGDTMALHEAGTMAPIPHPIERVLRERQAIRLPPGTVMVRGDGSEIMIDDSTSPIVGSDGTLDGAVMVFHDITAACDLQSEVDYLARHDFLTGLPNRFAAQQHLDKILCEAEERGRGMAVMYLDLDNFKWINDTLGHAAGDHLLVSVAERLRTCCRAVDVVSRQGGDEFLILMAPGTKSDETTNAAQRILDAVAQPHEVGGDNVHVGCSVGIALFPEHGAAADTLLQHADTALHAAKAAGRNTFRIFRRDMLDSVMERRTLEHALRHALGADGLALFYQPKVRLADGAILGCESLLRWRHPHWSRFSPADMIRCAEQSGLIVTLGRWVMREAMRQARAWRDSHAGAGPIAINVSALELRQGDFVEHLADSLAHFGIAPSLVQVELTESTLMRDVAGAVVILERLKSMGMLVAIDDFGTGYSNLGYLADMPIDLLKVDRSFVQGIPTAPPRRQAMLRAVLSIASNLGVPTIAEGIETAAEATYLMEAGCHFGQGFLYSPAVDARAFERLLAR